MYRMQYPLCGAMCSCRLSVDNACPYYVFDFIQYHVVWLTCMIWNSFYTVSACWLIHHKLYVNSTSDALSLAVVPRVNWCNLTGVPCIIEDKLCLLFFVLIVLWGRTFIVVWCLHSFSRKEISGPWVRGTGAFVVEAKSIRVLALHNLKGFPWAELPEIQAYGNPLYVDRYELIEIGWWLPAVFRNILSRYI